jgi:hypothetical protein
MKSGFFDEEEPQTPKTGIVGVFSKAVIDDGDGKGPKQVWYVSRKYKKEPPPVNQESGSGNPCARS